MTFPAAATPVPAPHLPCPLHDEAAADAWILLRARWDVQAGSQSERALAVAVLAEWSRHSAAERRAAAQVLCAPRPPGDGGRPCSTA